MHSYIRNSFFYVPVCVCNPLTPPPPHHTALFVVVNKMSFTLACISTCLYSASSQILSLDRTIGGRIFSGVLFIGCMLSAGILGGALSSIAWTARGDYTALLEYLPEQYQKVPSKYDIGLILTYFPKITALPLPSFVQEEFHKIQAELESIEPSIFPEVSSAFYVLIIVLGCIALAPLAAGRAHPDFRIGILIAISTLFMGGQLIFAVLMPILGIRLYWTQITSGYVKVALVNGGAMVVTALLVMARSTHDALRERLGYLIRDVGGLLSQSASAIVVVSAAAAVPKGNGENNEKNGEEKALVSSADEEAVIVREMATEARILAQDLQNREHAGARHRGTQDKNSHDVEVPLPPTDMDEHRYYHTGALSSKKAMNALDLQAKAREVTALLSSALFEPPLWGITSQPGANRSLYEKVLKTTEKLLSIAASLDACSFDANFELHQGEGKENDDVTTVVSAAVRTAVSIVLGSCAACCQSMSIAMLEYDSPSKRKKQATGWQPHDDLYWKDLRAALMRAAGALPAVLDSDVDIGEVKGRAIMAALTSCEAAVNMVKELEHDVARALDVGYVVIDNDKKEGIDASNQSIKKEKKPLKQTIVENAYAPSILTLLVLGLGLPVWYMFIGGIVTIVKGLFTLLTSSASRRDIWQNRNFQFGIKYFVGMALMLVTVILILWLGYGSGQGLLADEYNLVNFFFVWQPIYAWITAAICVSQNVEAAASRAILRSTMTALGGTLGFLAMLNGSLAQNPYWIAGMLVLFNALLGLLSPIKSLRYSLFLCAFTYNAVMACQYFGCCNLAGDTQIFGGKVVSTLLGSIYAMVVSWCFFPYYTSEKMLRAEASSLTAGVALIEQIHQHIEDVARNSDATPATSTETTTTTMKTWADEIGERIRGPLAGVRKDLEVSVIDRKQLLLTWNVLPTPVIVEILLGSLSRLADLLETAVAVVGSELWPGAPSLAQTALLDDVHLELKSLHASLRTVAASCEECMLATSPPTVLSTRETVREGVQTLWAVRASLKAKYMQHRRGATTTFSAPDFRFLAWVHVMLMAAREVEVIAVVLCEGEAALDRDTYFAWASSWLGRRPVV